MDIKICSSSVSILGGSLVTGAASFDLDENGKTMFYILKYDEEREKKIFSNAGFFLVGYFFTFSDSKIECRRQSIILNSDGNISS